jgi:coproporphyrinogen III oxidase-like Fe-S oxidoreductase
VPFCEVKCSYCHFAIDAQLLELESDHMRRTERGVLISNEVFRALV